MFNKVILIGCLGQNAKARTAQNKNGYVILNIATWGIYYIKVGCIASHPYKDRRDSTQQSWKDDKETYENRTEWDRTGSMRGVTS